MFKFMDYIYSKSSLTKKIIRWKGYEVKCRACYNIFRLDRIPFYKKDYMCPYCLEGIPRWKFQGKVCLKENSPYLKKPVFKKRDLLNPNRPPKSSSSSRNFTKRFQVLKRDLFRCVYCGRGSEQGAILEVDHLKPKSLGGSDDIDNLATACFECNRGKRDKSLTDSEIVEIKLKRGNDI